MTAVFLVAAFGQRVNVIGDSMSPVLKNGNVVMINHFIYNIKDPLRGDIAAFTGRPFLSFFIFKSQFALSGILSLLSCRAPYVCIFTFLPKV